MPLPPPVPVENNSTRSEDYRITIKNEYRKEQKIVGFWDDVEKHWINRSTRKPIKHESIVNFQPIN